MWVKVKASLAESADTFKVPRKVANTLYSGGHSDPNTRSAVWKNALRLATRKQVGPPSSAHAGTSAAASSTMPAASRLPPGQLAAHNAAAMAGTPLEVLTGTQADLAGSAAAQMTTAAQKAARTATEAALVPGLEDAAVTTVYLDKLVSVTSKAIKVAWKLATDLAAGSAKSAAELYIHPYSQGWVLPDLPHVTEPAFKAEFRRMLALPWAFYFDVGSFNRTPRVLPCCDRCGRNSSDTDGSTRRVHKKCMEWKEVRHLGKSFAVIYVRHKCSFSDCPGVRDAKAKHDEAQRKVIPASLALESVCLATRGLPPAPSTS